MERLFGSLCLRLERFLTNFRFALLFHYQTIFCLTHLFVSFLASFSEVLSFVLKQSVSLKVWLVKSSTNSLTSAKFKAALNFSFESGSHINFVGSLFKDL